MYRVMDLCNLYDFYTSVFTLAFTPCTFNVLFYVRIKYYNNNNTLLRNRCPWEYVGLRTARVRTDVALPNEGLMNYSGSIRHQRAVCVLHPVMVASQ